MYLRTRDEWKCAFEECGAIHRHDYNPKRPHAVFTDGAHSPVVFNGDIIARDPLLLGQTTHDTTQLLIEEGLDLELVDWVVSAAMGGITLSHDLARNIALRRSHHCYTSFAEKRSRLGRKWMVFARRPIPIGARTLLFDDTMTEGGTKERLIEAVLKSKGIVLPYLPLLLNRSGMSHFHGLKIVSLVHTNWPTWTKDECELCKIGSKPIRVKGKNWGRLTADYS